MSLTGVHSEAAAASILDAFLEAQMKGDARAAIGILAAALNAGVDAAVLRREVVAEAQRIVGEKWANDELSVAHEHMATAIAQAALSHLYWHAPPSQRIQKTILVTCLEGELHGFPARLAADALDLAGFDVKFLGADVPLRALVDVIRSTQPDMLAISITLAFHVPKLAGTISAVRKVAPGLPIVIGGHATNDWTSLAKASGADAGARTAEELIEICNRKLRPEFSQ